jgi:hypothetical protein
MLVLALQYRQALVAGWLGWALASWAWLYLERTRRQVLVVLHRW